DRHVLAFDKADIAQALAKSGEPTCEGFWRTGVKKSDHRHRRLLRVRGERPRRRYSATKKCDELAPFHSMTSLASARSIGGMLRPSAFAVLRLMISSSLVASWTGSSPGFSPLRTRPV